MRRLYGMVFLLAAIFVLPMLAAAQPIPGFYYSAFRGGAVLRGHVSVSRQFPNSGNPKVFNGQSWTGAALGTQWEIKCGVELVSAPPDSTLFNKQTGTGFITYHQTFDGGTFSLYVDPAVGWGSGSGTLNTTSAVSQVRYQGFIPVASSFTAFTSGNFYDGCHLDFAMSNGFGVGETPFLLKPPTYPVFLAADCMPADVNHQFGIWADANDIIAEISCPVSSNSSSWGRVKAIYR